MLLLTIFSLGCVNLYAANIFWRHGMIRWALICIREPWNTRSTLTQLNYGPAQSFMLKLVNATFGKLWCIWSVAALQPGVQSDGVGAGKRRLLKENTVPLQSYCCTKIMKIRLSFLVKYFYKNSYRSCQAWWQVFFYGWAFSSLLFLNKVEGDTFFQNRLWPVGYNFC